MWHRFVSVATVLRDLTTPKNSSTVWIMILHGGSLLSLTLWLPRSNIHHLVPFLNWVESVSQFLIVLFSGFAKLSYQLLFIFHPKKEFRFCVLPSSLIAMVRPADPFAWISSRTLANLLNACYQPGFAFWFKWRWFDAWLLIGLTIALLCNYHSYFRDRWYKKHRADLHAAGAR